MCVCVCVCVCVCARARARAYKTHKKRYAETETNKYNHKQGFLHEICSVHSSTASCWDVRQANNQQLLTPKVTIHRPLSIHLTQGSSPHTEHGSGQTTLQRRITVQDPRPRLSPLSRLEYIARHTDNARTLRRACRCTD